MVDILGHNGFIETEVYDGPPGKMASLKKKLIKFCKSSSNSSLASDLRKTGLMCEDV